MADEPQAGPTWWKEQRAQAIASGARCPFHLDRTRWKDRKDGDRIVTTCRDCGAFIGARPLWVDIENSRRKRNAAERENIHEANAATDESCGLFEEGAN